MRGAVDLWEGILAGQIASAEYWLSTTDQMAAGFQTMYSGALVTAAKARSQLSVST